MGSANVNPKQVTLHLGNHLRELAGRGELRPGDRLPPERELARQLCISRPSLRESISHLATFGILKSVHGVGTFVMTGLQSSPISRFDEFYDSGYRQMFETRLALEPEIAFLAAERATEHQVQSLADAVVEMSAFTDNPDQYLIHDIRFHRMVTLASGNPVLGALMETVKESAFDHRNQNNGESIDLQKYAEEHRKIYRAIRSHNPVGARLAMERHLNLCRMAMIAPARTQSGRVDEAVERTQPTTAELQARRENRLPSRNLHSSFTGIRRIGGR
jgi:GntR family transcriptional repressor for pyruvate dehydrogenase complex